MAAAQAAVAPPDYSQLDPDEFLGGGPSGGSAAPANDYGSMDPDSFLGIAPAPQQRPVAPWESQPSGNQPWNITDSIGNGLLLGAGPAVRAAGDFFRGNGFAIDRERAARAKYNQENPITSEAAEFGGSIPTTTAALAFTPGLSPLLTSPSLLTRVAGAGVAGAEAAGINTPLTGGDLGNNMLWGAGLSALFPFAGNFARKAFLPKVDPNVLASAQKLASEHGVQLRPSQIAMNKTLREADELLASGGNEKQMLDFTRAVGRTFGADSDRLTPKVMADAKTALQKRLDDVALATDIDQSVAGPALDAKLAAISRDLAGMPTDVQKQVRGVIKNVRDGFVNGSMKGKVYQELTNYGGPIGNLAADSSANTRLSGSRIREALDDALEASAGPGVRQEWQDARAQMKNFRAIQPLTEQAQPHGIVDPGKVQGVVRKYFSDYGLTESSGLASLGEGGRYVPRPTETGDAKGKTRPPWLLREGTLLPIGAIGEYALAHLRPDLALVGGGIMGGLAATRAAVGRTLQGKAPFSSFNNMLMNPSAAPKGGALIKQIPAAVSAEQRVRKRQ